MSSFPEAPPRQFVLPDWDNNILTLIRAIADPARHAAFFERLEIGEPQILVLLVIDGMIRERVESECDLGENLRREIRLTSLAPSATAPVITSIATGLSPRGHGATGWVTWCRELGAQVLPLPFLYQAGGELAAAGHSPERLFYGGPSLFEQVAAATGRACFQILPRGIAGSVFTSRMLRGAKAFPFVSLAHMFETLAWVVRWIAASRTGKAFVYAYTDALDQTQHRFGLAGSDTERAYKEVGKELRKLAGALHHTDVAIIGTSDHGFVDCPPEEAVFLDDHPRLAQMLRLPLSGEPRFAYCHLKPGKEPDFLDYVSERLRGKFFPIPTASQLAERLFGDEPEHPGFRDRIGDYILAATGGAAIHDPLSSEPLKAFYGLHGSLAAAEMEIPLIVIRP
jgi:hypothetical protein